MNSYFFFLKKNDNGLKFTQTLILLFENTTMQGYVIWFHNILLPSPNFCPSLRIQLFKKTSSLYFKNHKLPFILVWEAITQLQKRKGKT